MAKNEGAYLFFGIDAGESRRARKRQRDFLAAVIRANTETQDGKETSDSAEAKNTTSVETEAQPDAGSAT